MHFVGEDGEMTYREISDPRDRENLAEESGVMKWMAKFPESCSIPPSQLGSLNSESLRKEFLKQLQLTDPKVTYECKCGFVSTVSVPCVNGNDTLSAQSSVFDRKKDAEADAAKKWMAAHKSTFHLGGRT